MSAGVFLPSPEIQKYGQELFAPAEGAPWAGAYSSEPIAGSKTDTQPVDEPAEPRTGNRQDMFGMLDYYNRIHIDTRFFDMGNLVSLQTRQVKVWNAFLVPKTLDSITRANDDGIELLEPSPAPVTYAPLKENTYTLEVSTNGPATIDATYTFNFTGANSPRVQVVGSRITAWTWAPNWDEPIVERIEWLTDVMTSYDGTEQRVKLRATPRRNFEFSFSASGTQRRRLDAAIYNWGARVWAVPIWPDGERLSATAAAGATTITVTTTTRDYHVGGLVMLLADDAGYEVAEILSLTASALTLKRPLVSTWAAGSCMVYPVRSSRMPASHGYTRFTGDFVYGRVRMDVDDVNEWPAATETLYRAYPVLTERPNWIDDIDVDFERKLAILDYGTGERAFVDESNEPNIASNFRWFLESRARVASFRSWMYARAGKFGAIWIPTWVDDLTVVAIVGATATSIDVEHCDYTRRLAGKLHRKDIRVQTTTGQVYYRRITGASELSDTVERLTIDTAFGVEIPAANFAQISFLMLSRLDADGVEINYFTGDAAQVAHPVKAIGHAV
jgi:hypothetical protein